MLSWLRLIRSRRVGPEGFRRLTEEYGSADAALEALPGIARASGLHDYAPFSRAEAEAELAAARAAGAFAVTLGDPQYPEALAAISDAPPLLWCRGDVRLLARPGVALVGARNASSLALRMARALAHGLAEDGFAVISGLARGVDAAAHEAALGVGARMTSCGAAADAALAARRSGRMPAAGGAEAVRPAAAAGRGGTIAVLAGGVDRVYPAENAPLAARIADEGLLVSEQPMGLVAQARHFPRRNRIVSGLSLGVVVVEAAPRSGSLITASCALEQGREVMAVPGHPFDGRAGGGNGLIREGATLIRDAADVRAALSQRFGRAALPGRASPAAATVPAGGVTADPGPAARGTKAQRAPEPGGGAPVPEARRAAGGAPRRLEAAILDRLGMSPLGEDQLLRDLSLSAAELAPALMMLELDGRIARQPGGLLARLG